MKERKRARGRMKKWVVGGGDEEQRKREKMAREEREGERNRAKCKWIKLI